MKRIMLTLLCGLFTLPASAEKLGLLSAYELALLKDPTLNAAKNTQLADRALRPIALASVLPQVSLNAGENSARNKSSRFFNFITREHHYTLSLSQALIDFNAWYNLSQAIDQVSQAKATFIAADQSLMVRVTRAYLDVLKAEDFLNFTDAKQKAVRQQLEETRQKYKVGLVAVTDVREAEARFDSATADVTQASNDLEDAKEALQEITGHPSRELLPLIPKLSLESPKPNKVSKWIDTAKAHNPSLMAARSAANAAKDARNAQYARYLPKVSLSATRGQERLGTLSDPNGSPGSTWSTSIDVTMNVFSGGSIYSGGRRAAYQYQAQLDESERVLRSTVRQTSSAYRGIETAISRVKSLRQAVLSSRTALKASRAAYEVGTRTSVDVLNSISDLFDNEQRLTEARHAYIINQLLLKQASGTLNAQDIAYVDSLLVKPVNEEKSD